MALYFGSSKVNVTLNNLKYILNLYSSAPVTNGTVLKSSDNYILKDSKGLFLTTLKEVE